MKIKFLRLALPMAMVCASSALTSIQASEIEIKINASATNQPISKYIYGQFIEHLGRCIYGGLWAEMLEDRKFYYPITGDALPWTLYTPPNRSYDGEGHPYELLTASPWLIIGPRQAVSMVKDSAYVGEHSPRITPPGNGERAGLVQERLGLIQGRSYIGRIVLAGEPAAAPIEVSLVWGSGASDRQTVRIEQVNQEFHKFPFSFLAQGSTDNGRLEITSRGKGQFRIGTVSLMPSDNVYGWRSDTLKLLKELNSPVYRWPGGNFVSGYDWRDGVGDPDRRSPRKNPAWKGIEHNDVGLHEFMDLCREIGAEPYIAVNTGLGKAETAAAQVEYANGAADTPMGSWRARNGHPQPFDVKWWAIGNEMYGDWQLGHMPLDQYLSKHRQVVEAMRKVDPTIRPIAVGSMGEWSQRMLADCADHMALISEHIYWQNKQDLLAHVAQVPEQIRRVAEAHRAYRKGLPSLRDKDIRIALDEWNFWYGPNEYGELGTRYFLDDALGIAAGLHEYFRNSDIFYMANYAQTVNVIGAIKTTPTEAAFETTGLVLKLYREHFGVTPVKVEGGRAPLDLSAAWTADGGAITIGIVNPTAENLRVLFTPKNCTFLGSARQWTLAGPSRRAYNAPGQVPQVTIQDRSFRYHGQAHDIAPLSVTVIELKAATQ